MNIAKELLGKIGGENRKRSITWYCGSSWERWTPANIDQGIAGSQTAVIYLSKEWTLKGHSVTVYNYCEGLEGIFDGVEYKNYNKFDYNAPHDILIVWKEDHINILDHPLRTKRLFLELQDVPFQSSQFTSKRLSKVDRIIVKSKFHYEKVASLLRARKVSRNKLCIIPNGVDIKYMKTAEARKPFRLIYASNYYRGLEPMLRYGWPIIKKEIPQAELHVYYGWGHFDSFRSDPKGQNWKKEMIALMHREGVIDHGRVGLDRLMEEKSRSAIHYYGCIWPETDCVSVRESALVGCVPVTTRYAPFAEKPYCITVGGEPNTVKTQEALARKVVELLRNPGKLEKFSARFRRMAAREDWNSIALRWPKLFV